MGNDGKDGDATACNGSEPLQPGVPIDHRKLVFRRFKLHRTPKPWEKEKLADFLVSKKAERDYDPYRTFRSMLTNGEPIHLLLRYTGDETVSVYSGELEIDQEFSRPSKDDQYVALWPWPWGFVHHLPEFWKEDTPLSLRLPEHVYGFRYWSCMNAADLLAIRMSLLNGTQPDNHLLEKSGGLDYDLRSCAGETAVIANGGRVIAELTIPDTIPIDSSPEELTDGIYVERITQVSSIAAELPIRFDNSMNNRLPQELRFFRQYEDELTYNGNTIWSQRDDLWWNEGQAHTNRPELHNWEENGTYDTVYILRDGTITEHSGLDLFASMTESEFEDLIEWVKACD